MHIRTTVRKSLVTGVLLFVSALLIISVARAQISTPWISSTLNVQKDGDLPTGSTMPSSFSGNRDCTDYKFITRPFRVFQTEISHTACSVQTPYGIVDPNGWLELNGTNTAGKLINFGVYSGPIPIPSSQTLINYTSGSGGLFLHFTKNLPGAITATTFNNGELEYRVNRAADISLRDKSNALLPTKSETMSFSGGGDWMIVEAVNRAVLRVNLQTFEALPFAQAFNYGVGLNPGLQTAITGDGRYGVIYSKNFSYFKIYDLSTCAAIPNSINAPVSCQSRDLHPIVTQQIPGLQSISSIRFINNETISFYANYHSTPGNPATNKIARFRMSAAARTNARIEMLALGDSYISGEGTFEYKTGTDIADNRCHLSLISYPYLVADLSGTNSYNSVACSGATTQDLVDTSPEYVEDKAQARGKIDISFDEEIYDNFLPGYRAQLNFVQRNLPNKVLISVGGNDIGFSKILRRCLEPDTCYSTYEDRVELVREINGRFPELVDTYTKINNVGLPGAKIYAVGYPQIVLPGGSCDLNVRLNAQELEFARLITAYLDEVIGRAAGRAGISYVDTQLALNGHRLCEAVDENVAVNGLTAGDNTPSFLHGPIGNESYHPNKLGHRLLAQSVSDGTEGLGKMMPLPSASSTPPPETGLEILNAPKSNRAISQINYDDDLTNDIIYREVWWDISLQGLKHSLKKSTVFNLVLNSDPTNLGSFTTTSSGDLSAQIRIPETVPTGFHTLHVYGQNLVGEPIDIYKTIYVAANESDYDDDGLPNSSDSCDTMPNSGVDYDKDGIDDACDGSIGSPPPSAPTTEPLSSDSSSTPSPAAISTPTNDSGSNLPGSTPSPITSTANPQMTISSEVLDNAEGSVLSTSTMPDSPAATGTLKVNSGPQAPSGLSTKDLYKPILAAVTLSMAMLALIVSKSLIRIWRQT